MIPILIVSLIVFRLYRFLSKFEPQYNEKVIDFPKHKEKIYVKAKSWGLSGNHEEILISRKPIRNSTSCIRNEGDCMFFYADEVYYKKENEDSLILVLPSGSFSKRSCIQTYVEIVFKRIKGYDSISFYRLNYKEYGFTRVSVY